VVAEECNHIQRIHHACIFLPNCTLVYVNYLSSAISTGHLSYSSNSHFHYRMLFLIAADTVILAYGHDISYFCIMIKSPSFYLKLPGKYCSVFLVT
jgi:hypothetical protein